MGGVTGLRLGRGTGIGAVLVFLSGGGRGVPGGGSGLPRPMGSKCLSGDSVGDGEGRSVWRLRASKPHFLAWAAALVIAASESFFSWPILEEEEDVVEPVSRRLSWPKERASEWMLSVLMLAGLGVFEFFLELGAVSVGARDCWGVKSVPLSEVFECAEETDEKLPDFSFNMELLDGEPTGVAIGVLVDERSDRAEIAAMALAASLWSVVLDSLNASAFVTSV